MPRGGSSLVYGKIALSSEETMDKLIEKLKGILKDVGYPERSSNIELKKEEEELKRQLNEVEEEGLKSETEGQKGFRSPGMASR